MRHRKTVGHAALTATLVAGLFAGASPAGTDYEALPLMERVKKDLLGIQNNITNANMRLRRDLGGIGSAGGPPSATRRPPTPAEACCSRNVEKIKEKIRRLNGTLEELDVHYSKQGNTLALAELAAIRDRLGVVAQGIATFKLAVSRDRAMGALDGCIRPFNELRTATLSLEACCPLADPEDGDPAARETPPAAKTKEPRKDPKSR